MKVTLDEQDLCPAVLRFDDCLFKLFEWKVDEQRRRLEANIRIRPLGLNLSSSLFLAVSEVLNLSGKQETLFNPLRTQTARHCSTELLSHDWTVRVWGRG